jgi:hypothetical protein
MLKISFILSKIVKSRQFTSIRVKLCQKKYQPANDSSFSTKKQPKTQTKKLSCEKTRNHCGSQICMLPSFVTFWYVYRLFEMFWYVLRCFGRPVTTNLSPKPKKQPKTSCSKTQHNNYCAIEDADRISNLTHTFWGNKSLKGEVTVLKTAR